MKKLGLITIHDTLNWGSLAQTYGLYKALESLGVDVQLIDYKNDAIYEKERIKGVFEVRSFKGLVENILFRRPKSKKKRAYDSFLYGKMKITKPYTMHTINEANDIFDAFMVGSDIVWGVDNTGYDYSYMLDFVNNNKIKLAFSSSIGDHWPASEDTKFRHYLSQFDYISVREKQASQWLEELMGIKCPVTCDPSMLWDASFYRAIEDRPRNIPDRFVLSYMCYDRKDAVAYAKEHKVPLYEINYGGKPIKGVHWVKPYSFGEWLWLLDHSEMTFTGSFHGTVFSLYFNRPFFWYHQGRVSRLDSIAQECNLMSRLANDGHEVNLCNNVNIDYDFVNKVINTKRQDSWECLKAQIRLL